VGLQTLTIRAFSGGAGCGKTHQLMRALSEYLIATPLQDGQKVLALTFMHGSRHRLEERLEQLQVLRHRTECSTIDSFAWRIVRRWSSLASRLGYTGIKPDQYERVCEAAGALLKVKEVCGWVVASFPVLLVDEAQDLTENRLEMLIGLAARLEIFAAADEFQCLNEALRPNPACKWLNEVCNVEVLTQPKRTSVSELLDAASEIRKGLGPRSSSLFTIQLCSNPPLAGTWLANALAWHGGGKTVAVITPTLRKFAMDALTWTAQNKTRRGSGPYAIPWEKSDSQSANSLLEQLTLTASNDIPSVVATLTAAGEPRVADDVLEWMIAKRRALGKTTFSKEEIEKAIKQGLAQRQLSKKVDVLGWKAMTVHGAKNREFDNVILLWPAAIGGSDEQKRRLLYNAVTRARSRCLVLVQAKKSLDQAPFV
jgi:UvrD-like helicase C-terminal domain/AAA domain